MAWIGGNRYLTQSEQVNNATEVYNYLSSVGYSYNSICAILGNMVIESTINPNIWQGLNEGNRSGGYGLCQWTPMTKIINFLSNYGISDWTNGSNQLFCLITNSSQWSNSGDPNAPSVRPPITWNGFKTSTLDVVTLTNYFMYYWERPSYDTSVNRIEERRQWAQYYYNYFGGTTPTPPSPPIPPTRPRRRMSIIYYMKRRL